MKLLKKVLITAVSVLTLTACGAASGDAAAKDVADKFWKAMDAGDFTTALTYTSDTAKADMEDITSGLDFSSMTEGAEVSEDTVKKMNSLALKVCDMMFNGYTIDSVEKVSDEEYTVAATVQLASETGDVMNNIDINSILTTDVYTEFMKLYDEDEQKAYDYLYGLLFDFMEQAFDEAAKTMTYEAAQCGMTVTKTDDGWKITDISGIED